MGNPVPYFLQQLGPEGEKQLDVLVARDFARNCLNTGILYVRSSRASAAFLTRLLIWLWRRPYEFSQKAFGLLLGHDIEEMVKSGSSMETVPWPEPRPKWAFLEPLNHFVSSVVYSRGVAEGWVGNLDEIVVFHFADGTGGVDSAWAEAGQYLDLFQVFFGDDQDPTALADPLWLFHDRNRKVEVKKMFLDLWIFLYCGNPVFVAK